MVKAMLLWPRRSLTTLGWTAPRPRPPSRTRRPQPPPAGHPSARGASIPPRPAGTAHCHARRAPHTLDELPREYQWTRHDLDRAKQQLESSTARLEAAHDTIAQHDRPFRRKGHENAIRNAHHDIETLPGDISTQRTHIGKLSDKLHDIDRRLHKAEQLDLRRPTLETQLADIDARLGDDRQVRTRQIRRDPPSRVVDTIGARPKGGQPSRAWDNAAGRLDQHQTAFGLTKGLGPTKGRKLPMGFLFSRALAVGDQRSIEQATTRERQQARQIEGPALRIR